MNQFSFTNHRGEQMTARLPVGDEDFVVTFDHERRGKWAYERAWLGTDMPSYLRMLSVAELQFAKAVILSAREHQLARVGQIQCD